MRSEGIAAALAFLENPSQEQDNQQKIAQSRPILEGLVNHANNLHQANGENAFALGGMLTYWKKENLWREIPECQDWWQFGDFSREILKLGLTKAHALIRIWKRSERLELHIEDIERIGWFQAYQVLRIATTPKECQKWLEDAEKYGQEAFVARVKNALLGRKMDDARTVTRKFHLTEDEGQMLNQMLEFGSALMKKDGVASQTDVLMYILTTWRTMVDGSKSEIQS